MNKTIRIGMISFAHLHANSYARCLQQIADVELIGVYDDDPARGAQWADVYKTAFYATLDALLDEDLDGVVICSENSKHRPLVEAAAGRVGTILCEKPIATSVEDARSMIERCDQTNTRLQIAFPVRFAPAIQHLKTVLDENRLGRIYSVKCTNHGSMPGGWFVDQSLSGGGAVIDHTVHVIDVLRWFWGAEVTEVYAEVGESLLHPDLGIDDAGMLSFQMSNGVFGTLDTSWSRPSSYPTWGDVKIEVLGEHGVVRVDALRQHLHVYSQKNDKAEWVHWGSDIDRGLIDDFTGMIRDGSAPSITGLDGLRAMEVALAAYESARVGKPVPVTPESV